MPSLRGINVSVAVQPGPERLPEFPHPDASSVRILPVQHSPGFPGPQSRRASASPGSSSSSRIHKTNPTVSVYIPSIPGAQFCIRYAVTRPPEPHCHVFFKVLMNGRSVTSWGIDPAVHSSGSVMRALYEPCDKWHYKEAGVVLKRQGIESRCFYFTSTPAAVPVADDGGLIEVHVFRAKGRRPRAPLLSNFRGQEQYGIASPSTGLVECPEETSYYDWVLIDPRDSPFASFRFHYRSWDSLSLLNLGFDETWPSCRENQQASSSLRGRGNATPVTVFTEWRLGGDDSDDKTDSLENDLTAITESSKPLTHASSLCREFKATAAEGATMATRKSIDSVAPSVAPSLLQYLDDGSISTEDIEYGTATEIPLLWDPSLAARGKRPLPQPPQRRSTSSSSSLNATPLTWPVDESPSRHPQPNALKDERGLDEATLSLDTLSISEGEWMKRSSPSKSPMLRSDVKDIF